MSGKTTHKPEYDQQVEKLCRLGATNDDVANFFGVATSTIGKWIAEIPSFSDALKAGREKADAEVADRLYRRALGYSHPAVKIFADVKSGEEKIVEYTKHYPPDTTACIFWLKNRRPDVWRDRVEHVMSRKLAEELPDDELVRIAQSHATDGSQGAANKAGRKAKLPPVH
jgi:hypothetical protein